jgi:hypothetical protein
VSEQPATEITGLYRFYDSNGNLLYIGRTAQLPRWRNHSKSKEWWTDIATATIEWLDGDAFAEERRAILAENPCHNRARWPVKRPRPIGAPPAWEPLPSQLRDRIAKAARRYARTEGSSDRIALATLVYEARLQGCRPMDMARAARMSADQIRALILSYQRRYPDAPPVPCRHGTGREALRAMKAAVAS